MNECSRAPAAPILDSSVRIEDLGLMIAGPYIVERTFVRAGHGIALLRIGKGKRGGGVGAEADRCRPPIVQIDSRGTGDICHDSIEHLTVSFVGIEALVEKIAKE